MVSGPVGIPRKINAIVVLVASLFHKRYFTFCLVQLIFILKENVQLFRGITFFKVKTKKVEKNKLIQTDVRLKCVLYISVIPI